MKTGDLKKRITLQSATANTDEYGQDKLTWSDFASVFAHVKAGSYRETTQADRLNPTVELTVTIRYRTDINPGMRVKDIGPIIGSHDPDGTNTWLVLKVQKGQAT